MSKKKGSDADLAGLTRELASLRMKVTESEKLIEIISRGKYQWQATFDAISDPVSIITGDYKIVRANLGLARMSKKDIRDIIGKKCFHVFAGRSSKCEGCPVKEILFKKKPDSGRLSDDIHGHDFVVNAFPFMDTFDEKESIVVHYRDITEEKRLQQELIQQEKMAAIGMLAGGVAHEINNPLGGIIAFTQLLKNDLKENTQMREDVEEIERAAGRCRKIVQDLLDFSRLSSGKKHRPVDLNSLLDKVIPFIKMELRSLNIELMTKFKRSLPEVYADPNRLEQVFLNLFTNACHAMKKGGVLKITTYVIDEKNSVCIEISDTGCGMSDEDSRKVFDPFFTTKMPGEGTGLGLSISYRIIKEHGGKIKVETKLGKGTVFKVLLPINKDGLEDDSLS